MDQYNNVSVSKDKKIETKSLIIGFLAGVIVSVTAIVTISFIYTSVPSVVSEYNDKEAKYIDLDTKFSNEYKNIYPSDSSSVLALNDSLLSAQKVKEFVSQIRPMIDDLARISSENSTKGKAKDWFAEANKCYVIRKDIYSKYDKLVDSQINIIKLIQTENKATEILDEIAGVAKEIGSYTVSEDKAHLIASIDKSIADLSKFSNSIYEMKKIISLPSLDGWISYSNKAIEFMKFIKDDVQRVGFTDTVTATDQEIIRRGVELRNIRTDVSVQYGKDVGNWVFTNRDSIQKDIDRLVIDANSLCDSAQGIYKSLFPNN